MTTPACILRPVRESDHDDLFHLVGTIGHGLTSLPNDPDFLAHRIDDSIRAFDPRIRKPGGELYLFVLEDVASGKIIGTSGILSRVGGFDPFYTYTIREQEQNYPPLEIRTCLQTLHLTKNHKGPTEICSLFLHRDFRSGGLGKLLSLARFCFMKSFPERFDNEVIAELRGYINDQNLSPFWEAVGVKFFEKDYYTADILSGLGEKEFIGVLMPKFPIYVSLLPESARSVIGRVHPHTEPARRILMQEGFKETNEVDIFDAGPILMADREELGTWKAAKLVSLKPGIPNPEKSIQLLLANGSLDFRAIIADAETTGSDVIIVAPETIEALQAQDAMSLAVGNP
ncbi:arginine N-succinyltransferase [Puniceicoccales bacterium CK1056]|uniref:Arginine N-succinyltransferase n=1 Tax=Oceanipulchritudo coccoides TaxID=2706888 RepID=A0A6B2LYT1_9BACT|nr:arginine N-succinyltransferase [Oceanipulchritudo coccoides]NDV61778.1 arginine N-succinyltransferase [Oceanipulchritudo coccoides]